MGQVTSSTSKATKNWSDRASRGNTNRALESGESFRVESEVSGNQPLALRTATRWSSRSLSVQLFGAVRHTARADSIGATFLGRPWFESEDFQQHPLDPPLSDEGRAEATAVAERIADFSSRSRPGLQIVICSPYLRCVETAFAICQKLGNCSRVMIDMGLGEVFGPEVFGDNEPEQVIRTAEELEAHLQVVWKEEYTPVSGRIIVSGSWPKWPESMLSAKKRYAERLLAYLRRGVKARRNFLLVSHADCVASCLALMPDGSRVVESVGYGGMLLASRAAPPTLLGNQTCSKKDSDFELQNNDEEVVHECSQGPAVADGVILDEEHVIKVPRASDVCNLTSDQRVWWGEEDLSAVQCQSEEDEDEKSRSDLLKLRQTRWQVESWNVKFGHRWCNGTEHAVANAMGALKRYGKKRHTHQKEVELLLGIFDEDTQVRRVGSNGSQRAATKASEEKWPIAAKFGRSGSHMSNLSYETYLFGCSERSLEEVPSNVACYETYLFGPGGERFEDAVPSEDIGASKHVEGLEKPQEGRNCATLTSVRSNDALTNGQQPAVDMSPAKSPQVTLPCIGRSKLLQRRGEKCRLSL
eukprot:TRINITY_DN95594_c0_g1_i1.p1 TRINITY_DN95594_c0_g1~~TRINITY_DN95594_c0_g1_i1.p1  ORF type:complete len:585 (-),score=100.00 TRINITY_DN95594_c0_g1_i1:213-1967(-)